MERCGRVRNTKASGVGEFLNILLRATIKRAPGFIEVYNASVCGRHLLGHVELADIGVPQQPTNESRTYRPLC